MALRRRRGELPSAPWLAVRGVIAVAVLVAVAATLIGRASGNLAGSADVYVGVPVAAGLITTQSPVRYHGVNIGRIAAIESGTETSRVRLAMNPDVIGQVPDTVVARIVPRTFFGDIYLQLVDGPVPSSGGLAAGDELEIDRSTAATALYGVFKRIVEVFAQLQPERMQTALSAISQALHGRGAKLGETIDDLSVVAAELAPAATEFLDTTPQFRTVMESLHEAAPDMIDALSSAAAVSQRMVEHGPSITATAAALAELGSALTSFLSEHREHVIAVFDSAGRILATTGSNPAGLVATLDNARGFGEAGARVFSTGKFNITAVATFQGPMPYDMRDCPVYGELVGAHCAASDGTGSPIPQFIDPRLPDGASADPATPMGAELPSAATDLASPVPHLPTGPSPPAGPLLPAEVPLPGAAPAAPASAVIDPDREARPLALLQDRLTHPDGGVTSENPSIATTLMLGPLVRGTEVRLP